MTTALIILIASVAAFAFYVGQLWGRLRAAGHSGSRIPKSRTCPKPVRIPYSEIPDVSEAGEDSVFRSRAESRKS
jgi:hypothetical protein